MEPQRTNSYILPIAILLGFGIIASVIFFADRTSNLPDPRSNTAVSNTGGPSMQQPVRTVTNDDFIRGNPNAPLMFVTYLDFDCPTCKSYYYAMDRLVREQGVDGFVGWAFRPLPADGDPTLLNTAYCAGAAEGENFWQFTDTVFDARDTTRRVDRTAINSYASSTGIALDEFNTCRNNNTYVDKITSLATEAETAGATQAPFTVLMLNDEQEALYGAQTYAILNEIVTNVRNDVENLQ